MFCGTLPVNSQEQSIPHQVDPSSPPSILHSWLQSYGVEPCYAVIFEIRIY